MSRSSFINDAKQSYQKMIEYANLVAECDAKIAQAKAEGIADHGPRLGPIKAGMSATIRDIKDDRRLYIDRANMYASVTIAASAMSIVDL